MHGSHNRVQTSLFICSRMPQTHLHAGKPAPVTSNIVVCCLCLLKCCILQVDDPSSLPYELVFIFLQYVPQQLRLSSCALVSHTWRTAAVAATTSISANNSRISFLGQYTAANALGSWLLQHGHQLHGLSVQGNPAGTNICTVPFKQLTQLRNLQLSELMVLEDNWQEHTFYAANKVVSWYAMTALTALRLQHVNVAVAHGLDNIYFLKALQQIQLEHVTVQGDGLEHVLCNLAGGLTQLTDISFRGTTFSPIAPTSPFSSSSQLQRLCIETDPGQLLTATLGRLPDSLTHLELVGTDNAEYDVNSVFRPSLDHLTKLCHLRLVGQSMRIFMHHALLPGFVQLTHLTLQNCCMYEWTSEGCARMVKTSVAIAVLNKLSNLRHLSLIDSLNRPPDRLHDPSWQLTALGSSSSKLTHLDLTNCKLVAGDIQRLFSSKFQHASLQELHLGFEHDASQLEVCALATRDLEHLAASCPNLQKLSLCSAVQSGTQSATSTQLSALSSLKLEGHAVNDSWLTDTLVKLTGLKELLIYDYVDVGVYALMELTQLTQLSKLKTPTIRFYREGEFSGTYVGPKQFISQVSAAECMYIGSLARWLHSHYGNLHCMIIAVSRILAIGWYTKQPACCLSG